MARYQEETDRKLRQEAWELVANRRLQEVDKVGGIFDAACQIAGADRQKRRFQKLRRLRVRSKVAAGSTTRLEDCLQFHTAIEKEIMPRCVRQLQARNAASN